MLPEEPIPYLLDLILAIGGIIFHLSSPEIDLSPIVDMVLRLEHSFQLQDLVAAASGTLFQKVLAFPDTGLKGILFGPHVR